MRHKKIFRILTLAVILTLLVVAIPATPVLAQSMVCSPDEGSPDTSITVTGTNYILYIGLPVYVLFDNVYIGVWSTISATGAFTITGTVPTTASTGDHYVTAQHSTPGYSPTTQIGYDIFTVSSAEIEIDCN